MRIFIAEPDKDLGVGLQFLLHQEPGIKVIGIADNGKGMPSTLEVFRPDVVLLDWNLPGVPMKELVTEIRALDFQLKIIVISYRQEFESVAMAAGADYFIIKNSPPDKLITLLRNMVQAPADST